jgi:hypothetical protein
VCRPKDFGGLRLVNTQIFNECLITNWIWKIYHQKDSLWVRLLSAKYMRRGDFYKSKRRMVPNSGKDCTKLSTCSNGVLFIRWVMDNSPNFGMMFG